VLRSPVALADSRRALQATLASIRDERRRAAMLGAALPGLGRPVLDEPHAALPPARARTRRGASAAASDELGVVSAEPSAGRLEPAPERSGSAAGGGEFGTVVAESRDLRCES
jgi:hypothetical protein